MKLKIYFVYAVIIFFLNALSSCNFFDQDPIPIDELELPKATQQGLNTFGCLVDGEVYVPSAGFGVNRLSANYYPDTFIVPEKLRQSFSIHSINQMPEINTNISIVHNSIHGNGEYILRGNDSSLMEGYGTARLIIGSKYYYTTRSEKNILEITKLDAKNRIISAVFQFDVVAEKDIQDTVKITDGRFDIKFSY
ncbi:hypothetical protein GYB22_08200 [bacterium]|nr:hypothetical protein [bacterium]